jgi:superfamily II DNA or RNA helicase
MSDREFSTQPLETKINPAIETATSRLEDYLSESRVDAEGRILRDKQLEVMEDLQGFLISHPQEPYGYISLPTGVGKTVLFTELVKATGLRTLVLTPTKLLLGQTENTFNRFSDEEIVVGKVYSGEKNGSEKITLTTYASFVRQTKNQHSRLIRPEQYDLLILDEAHRALAKETRKALASYKNAIQIGFTATEEYSEQRSLQSLLPVEIHKMTIKEAVGHRLITPFTNLLVETGVDVSDVKITTSNEYDMADLEKALNTERRNKIAVELYHKYFAGMKAVAFCNGVAHAEAVAEAFAESGVNALAVHGGMSMRVQTASKAAFAESGVDGINVLTNDKLLAEGFDAPQATVCFNLAPTLSRVRAQQRSGRILRLDPDDPLKHAYIVDFIDESYRKTPVLFSDPNVAEQAQVGDQNNSIFNNAQIELAVEHARVIADPVQVTDKARQFMEGRKAERRHAPDNWLSLGQISALYNIPKQTVRNELDTLVKDTIDKYGEFHNPKNNTRTTRYYFHPDVVQQFAVERGLTPIDFNTVTPVGWTKADELDDLYPPRVLKSALHFVGLMQNNVLSDHAVSYNGVEYYSVQLKKLIKQNVEPDGTWLSVEPLLDVFNTDVVLVEELCKVVARRDYTFNGFRPCWFLIEDREVMHVSPFAYKELENELAKIGSQRCEAELTDGLEVELRNRNPDIDLLIHVFSNARKVSPIKPVLLAYQGLNKTLGQNQAVDELYDLFS